MALVQLFAGIRKIVAAPAEAGAASCCGQTNRQAANCLAGGRLIEYWKKESRDRLVLGAGANNLQDI